MSWATGRRAPPPRFRRAGQRLALALAAVVVGAFALAGFMAELSLEQITQKSIRNHILGEAASLDDEVAQKGEPHLAYTVAKRSRLWRGFEYRLADPAGHWLAGRLPPQPGGAWGYVQATAHEGAAHEGQGRARYLTYTHSLQDGARLTVGQDLATEAGEADAITRALVGCGLLGVAVCLVMSTLVARRTWRRIADISAAAAAVAEGRLDVRVARPSGAARDDIDALAQAFNVMLDRIELLLAQVRQVSTDIAHDLRTPLNRFAQRLERLRLQVGRDPVHLQAVSALERDLDEIVRTFDALLQLSEIETAEAMGRVRIVDLAEVAQRVSDAYRPDLEAGGRILEVEGEATPIAADERLIAQSLANLIENAMRHTPVGARVRVEVGRSGRRGQLVVVDDGPGVPAEARNRVLKPFVRLTASRSTPGSGLGLSIVAAVAARHGAALSLEDAGPGLRVRISFPLAETPAPARQPEDAGLAS